MLQIVLSKEIHIGDIALGLGVIFSLFSRYASVPKLEKRLEALQIVVAALNSAVTRLTASFEMYEKMAAFKKQTK